MAVHGCLWLPGVADGADGVHTHHLVEHIPPQCSHRLFDCHVVLQLVHQSGPAGDEGALRPTARAKDRCPRLWEMSPAPRDWSARVRNANHDLSDQEARRSQFQGVEARPIAH
ncbi:unnamed protein product [Penicillium pancosmium]